MIDVGDPIVLTYPTKPASPATVNVTIGLPDGTTAGPFSAPSGTYTYTTTQVGRHTVSWTATGPSDAYSDAFDVAPADATYLISLADAKAMLRVTQSTNDEELRTYLSATTEIVEHYVGTVVPRSFTEIHNGGGYTLMVRKPPIITVTSLTEVLGNTTWTLTEQPVGSSTSPYGFSVDDPDAGKISRRTAASWLLPFTPGSGNLTVTYTAGRRVIPSSMQIAARLIVGHLWANRRLAMSLPKPAAVDAVETVPGLGYSVPTEALELLDAYEATLGIA